jgi:3-oxoacyl-(acyl-carrier-protein) synthase
MRRGERGLVTVAGRVAAETRARLAGLVPEFRARDVDRRLDLKGMNPLSAYATTAARLALDAAGVRVGPREGLETGVVNGLYAGPGEERQMMAVIPSGGAEADIPTFSHIVANATAGWISNALLLKGYSTTVSQGPDAGLFALLMAHFAVRSRSAPRILAGAADELFSRYLENYDELDLLHTGRDEGEFGLRPDVPDRRVLGEGAAYVVTEEAEVAAARGAAVLAEVKGYGMTTDCAAFYEPMLAPEGLVAAIAGALTTAGWSPEDVGLVIWSPQGNAGDAKALGALEAALPGRRPPLVTTVFHTGLCESASGTATLAAVLDAWSRGEPLWPQITGSEEIDGRPLPAGPTPILALATSDLGYNLALAIEPREGAGA